MASTRGRQVVVPLTNKSGGGVVAGDVVIVDTSNDASFTTTTTARSETSLGVVQDTIANNGTGRVLISGYAALVNVPASVTRGHYIETHTVAKQATGNSTRRSGSCGQFLTGGTTPTGLLWGNTDQTATAAALTHAQVGTTSLGGSFDTTQKTVYKKITIATACLISSISVGVKGQSTSSAMLHVGIMSDNSGTPLNVIAAANPTRTVTLSTNGLTGSFVLNATARFIQTPIGAWVSAADYWLVFTSNANSGNDIQYAYASGTGSDRTKAATDGIYDHSVGASSAGTNDYSIFCDTIR